MIMSLRCIKFNLPVDFNKVSALDRVIEQHKSLLKIRKEYGIINSVNDTYIIFFGL